MKKTAKRIAMIGHKFIPSRDGGVEVIPMSDSYRILKTDTQKLWTAPTPEETANEIWMIEREGEAKNAQ